LKACDFTEAIWQDAFFHDEIEVIPGSYIISIGDIKKFMTGESFEVQDEEGNIINIKADDNFYSAFIYYYDIWENWNQFEMLPHGGGWLDELPWVIDFIKYFNSVYNDIEKYRIKRRQ
jgi:hypothetical protein